MFEPGLLVDNQTLKLVELIAKGGEAEVWKATQNGMDPIIRAIKLREPVQLEDSSRRRELMLKAEDETMKWASICNRSVYILNIYKTFGELHQFKDDEYLVIGQVCEFSAIGSIDTANKTGVLQKYIHNELSFVELTENIISGISAGHLEEIAHCDIKPSNILLFEEGGGARLVPKIADFGVARARYEELRGFTPSYAPPEVLREKKFSFASDVYSLGLTLTEIMFRTLLRKTSDDFSGYTYRSGAEFKKYIEQAQRSETRIGQFDPSPYFGLFDSMTSDRPSDRPTLDQVSDILRNRRLRLQGQPSDYSPKLSRNTYAWHPELHRALETKLYFVLLRGGSPSRDVPDLKQDLRSRRVDGYALHSVAGGWDYMVKVRANAQDFRTKVRPGIERTAVNGLLALEVSDTLARRQPRSLDFGDDVNSISVGWRLARRPPRSSVAPRPRLPTSTSIVQSWVHWCQPAHPFAHSSLFEWVAERSVFSHTTHNRSERSSQTAAAPTMRLLWCRRWPRTRRAM